MKLILPRTAFNPIYLPLLEPTGKRYHILFGSAGSGKSYFIAQMLIVKALREKRKILVLRKVGRTVKNSVFQLLLDTLTD
jgi:phage terminase large subunit